MYANFQKLMRLVFLAFVFIRVHSRSKNLRRPRKLSGFAVQSTKTKSFVAMDVISGP